MSRHHHHHHSELEEILVETSKAIAFVLKWTFIGLVVLASLLSQLIRWLVRMASKRLCRGRQGVPAASPVPSHPRPSEAPTIVSSAPNLDYFNDTIRDIKEQ